MDSDHRPQDSMYRRAGHSEIRGADHCETLRTSEPWRSIWRHGPLEHTLVALADELLTHRTEYAPRRAGPSVGGRAGPSSAAY